jgi:cation diffusion facilitator CzcD-associated flavoprotein CzcO
MTAAAEAPLDLLVIGAGLAGVGAAAEYLKRLPGRRIAVLESRADLGGTWDLFRYPGVRSDSDMFTFGYRIRPWRGLVSMAADPLQPACHAPRMVERRGAVDGHRPRDAAGR